MKHHRIVIAAISVAIALPALGQRSGSGQASGTGQGAQTGPVAPPPPASPQQWAASSAFIYPSQEYWSKPENIAGFIGSYKFKEEVEPVLSTEEQVLFREVLGFMELNQKEQALQRLITHYNAFPNASAAIPFNIGNLYVDQGQLEPALPYYQQAITKFENFHRAHRILGIVYMQLGRFEEAIPHLLKTVNLGTIEAVTYGLLGVAYYETGKLMAAEAAYRNAVVFDPDQADWQAGLAQVLMDAQKYTDAIAILDQLIVKDPQGTDLWAVQANAFIALEQINRAAGNFEILRRMDGASSEWLLLLGDIYINEDLKDMAIEVFLEAVEKGGVASATVPRLVRAAQIFVGRNNLAEAGSMLAAIEENFQDTLTPDDELMVLKLRSQIAIANGESDQAAEILQQVVDSDPFDGEALMLLGAHFRNKDEIAEAEIYFERAAKVQEFRVRARTNHAQMLINVERYSDALPLLEQAYQMEPSDPLQRYIQQVRAIIQRSAAF